ncbi:unnamed protein product [Clonostachys rhizophaga]|uniref:NAD-dependent epimerase/dehydratase domain-containing protein n=1 Tax=Clonostachys rhizophaga TaxID=160324 RepID=A0A9N9YM89_9HYPO|nr:unnamed protein product [Clonostachys rhizophaga]
MTSSRIFITGATGFIGSQVAAFALRAGHDVRFSVRREDQVQLLKSRFSEHARQLEFVVIKDLSNSDSIKNALGGVEYIFHLASPMAGAGSDFKTEYVDPAVKGTVSILDAAAASPAVSRVVVVSSGFALMPMGGFAMPGLKVYENSNRSIEVDMNMEFTEDFIGHTLKYQASKILAHRATLDWIAETTPSFDLITLHPSFVLGEDLTQVDETPKGVNGLFVNSLLSDKPIIPSSFVDVRDVAVAHLKALTAPVGPRGTVTEAIIDGPTIDWDTIVKFVGDYYPEFPLKLSGPFPEGATMDNSRAERDFGIKWHTSEETIRSVLDQQVRLRKKASL